jgi:hypothetical protein
LRADFLEFELAALSENNTKTDSDYASTWQ